MALAELDATRLEALADELTKLLAGGAYTATDALQARRRVYAATLRVTRANVDLVERLGGIMPGGKEGQPWLR